MGRMHVARRDSSRIGATSAHSSRVRIIPAENRWRHGLPGLLASVLLLTAGDGLAAGACAVDTTQANFQLGVANNVTVLGSGDVTLASNLTVDQQNTSLASNGYTFHSYWWFGQTFTAGVSGPLTAADVRLFCNACTGTTPDITVAIRAVSGNLPTGGDLATATIPGFSSASGGWFKATFAEPINMVAGTKYALIVRSVANPSAGIYAYLVSATDVYAGGARLTSTNSGSSWEERTFDVGFRIYTGSGHVAAGDLVSSVKDANPPAGSNPTWSTLSWNAATPASTVLRFQAAASNSTAGPFNFVGPDGTSATYFTASGAPLSQFNGNRYLKYKALLSTTHSAVSPTLNDVTACHDSVLANGADLRITKTDGQSTATAGSSVIYTIVASNAGPNDVASATVVDNFPAALENCEWVCEGGGGGSCSAAGAGHINQNVSLPAGGSATFTAICDVKSHATGSLSNTATVSSAVPDPVPANNSATDTDTLTASADISVEIPESASEAVPGGQLSFVIVAGNAGASAVSGALVKTTLPSGVTCSWTSAPAGGATSTPAGNGNINDSVNLPVGATVAYTVQCSVWMSAKGSLVIPASVSSAVHDPVPANNAVSMTISLASDLIFMSGFD